MYAGISLAAISVVGLVTWHTSIPKLAGIRLGGISIVALGISIVREHSIVSLLMPLYYHFTGSSSLRYYLGYIEFVFSVWSEDSKGFGFAHARTLAGISLCYGLGISLACIRV